jgi:hypothetical protein
VPQEQLLECFAGENRTLSLAARDNSNNPSNLTSKTVTWGVSFPPYAPDWRDAIITKTGTVTDAANGLYTVALTPSDTQCLMEGNYTHQAYTTDGTGSVSIVTEGTFRLRRTIGPVT